MTKALGARRKQTPVLLPTHLAARQLLGSAAPERAVVIPELITGTVTQRDQAVAAILRGVADLIDS